MVWHCRFDHFMQKEIHEQPDSILQTMRGRVAFNRTSLDKQVPFYAVIWICSYPIHGATWCR